jgi:hypothetical protein
MIIKLFFIFFVSLSLSTTALAESYALIVLNSKVEDYERVLVSCKKSENERGLPDKDILKKLGGYKDQELREFLVTSSSIALIKCTMPELGELSFFVGAILNSKETSDESKKEARYISELIHEISWSNYKINNELSSHMKSDFEEHDYFKSPFDPFLILEKLNIL